MVGVVCLVLWLNVVSVNLLVGVLLDTLWGMLC